eukprot:Selendium_serpulae@DN1552_c0_g1_i1.p1
MTDAKTDPPPTQRANSLVLGNRDPNRSGRGWKFVRQLSHLPFSSKTMGPTISRSALHRQNSAFLLRNDATPSSLRVGKLMEPEAATTLQIEEQHHPLREHRGITLLYRSGWVPPCLHHRAQHGVWTAVPGTPMTLASHISGFMTQLVATAVTIHESCNGKADDGFEMWCTRLDNMENLEFVPNGDGKDWDHAPNRGNYFINSPGRYFLSNGVIHELLLPPGAPALIDVDEVRQSVSESVSQ